LEHLTPQCLRYYRLLAYRKCRTEPSGN